MKSRLKPFLLLMIAAVHLSACGIKPNDLTPADEKQQDAFPHVYPHDITGKVKNK